MKKHSKAAGPKAKKTSQPAAEPKVAKTRKAATPASARVTKTDTVLEMMRRKGGATAAELLKLTGWQKHTLRGFVAGACRVKLGLDVKSEKNEAGERVYSLEA